MNFKALLKITLVVVVVACTPLQLWAENAVLVRADSVPMEDYKTACEANRDFVAFETYWSHRSEDQEIRRDLRAAFAHAQEIFLQSEISEMKKEWEAVADYALKNDWPTNYRRLIQVAQMRRAQLATKADETELWLKNIISLDSSYEPDRNLFPPPLVERYRRLRTQIHRRTIALGPNAGFDALLVNGVAYKLEKPKRILFADGEIRATYISSRYLPVTRVLNSRALAAFHPEKSPIVTGDCASPSVASRAGFNTSNLNLALMYSKNCVVSVQKASHVDPSALNVVNQGAIKYSNPIETSFNTADQAQPFYKKTWFWVGATLLAGGLIAISQQHETTAPQPSRTEGF